MQGSNRDTDIENRLTDTGKEEGEGGVCGESNMETYITICKIDNQWEFVYNSQNSNQGPVTTQRGGIGRKVGGRLKRKGHMYTYG